MSFVRFIAWSASLTSALIILSSITSVYRLYEEINEFHDVAIQDMEEFRRYANDAWTEMLASSSPSAGVSVAPSLFARPKRGLPPQCNCGPAPDDHCPPGPAGPPGNPGTPGDDGNKGEDGKDGGRGIAILTSSSPGGCVVCPQGAPGEAGPDGEEGPAGVDGGNGKDGSPGKDGRPGAPGARGEQGRPGPAGRPGKKGGKGRNGKKGHGKHGPPGRKGSPGARGHNGPRGAGGQKGIPGPQGPPGFPGNDGQPGQNGSDGTEGEAGHPGSDAAYCPCPPRITQAETHYEAPVAAPAPSVQDTGYPSPAASFHPPTTAAPAAPGPAPQGYSRRRV